MIDHEIKIAFAEYAAIEELGPADAQLCEEAVLAMQNSHSPYSSFRVGAALRLKSGRVIRGSNQENVAYPSGLCAERVALFHWGATFPDDPIQAIVITAHTDQFKLLKPVTPCGSCLQVLAEYEKKQDQPIKVILYCKDGPVWVTQGIESFLPFLFFEHRLVSSH
jgi:cytidine deaminase